ncbi:MAG: metal-dependent hydrolase [Planctomycetota bacterium]
MPSPIAHASVAFVGARFLGERPASEPRWRSWAVALLVVFACGAPDLDIIAGWIFINDGFTYHGLYSHSLLVAPAFGVLFAIALRVLRPSAALGRAFALGAALYAIHVILDALIYDTRGVAMLWPIIPDRFASPFVIFVGVEYSHWWRWEMHVLTIVNEVAFGIVMLWLSRQTSTLGEARRTKLHAAG